ncbi:MAG: ABC transporter ATP-binding protein [Bacteroidota bacterium]|jgi:Cu-processing system ATP-binding protein
MIRINNLSVSFKKTEILHQINLSVEKGGLIAIAGPNGSGKTTLIKSILGLVKINSGKIFVNEKDIDHESDYRSKIGFMPQIARYPDNLTINEIFSMVKTVRNHNTKSNEKHLIELFNLEAHVSKYMRNLSGGTRQKVGAVLAFMFNPDIYILDEPSVGLDPVSSGIFKNLLLEEKQKGKTIIYISHILNEVDELANRLVFLIEGRIYLNEEITDFKKIMNEQNLEKAVLNYMQAN